MFSNFENFKAIRNKAESNRIKEEREHEILYFHKVDDPYSHLTIQFIDKLIGEYSIKLSPVLVGDENPETLHEPSLYNNYCLEDVKRIAPYYGVDFGGTSYPNKSLVNLANSILASVPSENFTEVAKLVSDFLWRNNKNELINLSRSYSSSPEEVNEILKDCLLYTSPSPRD